MRGKCYGLDLRSGHSMIQERQHVKVEKSKRADSYGDQQAFYDTGKGWDAVGGHF